MKGQGMVEWALLLILILVVAIVVVATIGTIFAPTGSLCPRTFNDKVNRIDITTNEYRLTCLYDGGNLYSSEVSPE